MDKRKSEEIKTSVRKSDGPYYLDKVSKEGSWVKTPLNRKRHLPNRGEI